MKNIFIFKIALLFIPFWISCKEKKTFINLHITNRSANDIDSIKIQADVCSLEKIAPGKTKTITIDMSKTNTNIEGINLLTIYKGGKDYSASWGLHDWGQFATLEENFYVFDHGINRKNENIQKPTDFSLFIINKSGLAIDSLSTEDNSLKKIYDRKIHLELLLNYSGFEKNPTVNVFQQSTKYTLYIKHDWDNWNLKQEIVYLYPHGELSPIEK
jgi:hypothetical protein